MHGLPTTLPTPPEAVVRRLRDQGLVVRSVWFPTRAELAAWEGAGVPVYVRPLSPHLLELGPRLGSMWASVFSPVLVLHLQPHGSGARATWSRRLPNLTRAVLALWVSILAAWGAVLAAGSAWNSTPFWILLAFATALAPVVGRVRGGSALDDGVPWLAAVLMAPDDEEDW